MNEDQDVIDFGESYEISSNISISEYRMDDHPSIPKSNNELEFGDSVSVPTHITKTSVEWIRIEKDFQSKLFFRRTQIHILLILVATAVGLVSLELLAFYIAESKNMEIAKDFMMILTPVFTFVLGKTDALDSKDNRKE